MNTNAREAILSAATRIAQSHGYSALSLRDLANAVGIKPASIYYHFPGKTELAAAVAKRYCEDGVVALQQISDETSSALEAVGRFPEIFRRSLERENKLCLGSFMGAETDHLPQEVLAEIRRFSEINIDWIATKLVESGRCDAHNAVVRASTIFAAIAGAQLLARTRSDMALFDTLVSGYRDAGLLPST